MAEEQNAFSCAECGSKDIKFPEAPQPGDMVICLGCGASNRYDEIQRNMVRDALKNLKGLKLE